MFDALKMRFFSTTYGTHISKRIYHISKYSKYINLYIFQKNIVQYIDFNQILLVIQK